MGNLLLRRRMMMAQGGGGSSSSSIIWETQSGTWIESGYEDALDGILHSCESPGDDGSTVVRCTFEGLTSITFMCAYWGENNYDYLTVGKIDTPCTRTSYGTTLKGTSGAWKAITFNCDASQHYVEFCYSKDGSVSQNGDYAAVYIQSIEEDSSGGGSGGGSQTKIENKITIVSAPYVGWYAESEYPVTSQLLITTSKLGVLSIDIGETESDSRLGSSNAIITSISPTEDDTYIYTF